MESSKFEKYSKNSTVVQSDCLILIMKISNFFLLSYVGTICLTAHGQAFHRCSVNGEIKYQQIPCLEAGIIVGEEIKIKQALKAEEE